MRSKWTLLWWGHVKPTAAIVMFPFAWTALLVSLMAAVLGGAYAAWWLVDWLRW